MSDQLRVAWLGHQSGRAGDGLLTYSRETVAGLRARGVKVFFVHHGSLPATTDDSLTLRSLTASHRYTISSPRTKRLITDLLRREHIDLVHVSLSFSTLIDFGLPDLCHELGLPVVATFHVPYDSRFSLWQGISTALYRLYAQSLASFDRVIIFSEQQKNLLESHGVPASNVSVIPNGVDIEKYAPGPSGYKQTLESSVLIGYLGRVDPEKNVDLLIRAFQDIDAAEEVKLVVIGGGSERRRLERRYRGSRVIFTGPVMDETDRITMLRAMDLFVLPSLVEGLSLSLLEAMACGVAPVATDVGSDGEALRGAGLLLDPKDLDGQLRLALRTLLEFPDFRTELGGRARARAVERYSLSDNLNRLLSVYRELRPAAGAAAS
ncbi:MAG: glycosyltransferase family 4 protein [Chloroflexi bacterium]|nr:MAG: glycosyltransferase family 4 protein [Chloroflexota bacterium]TME46294.1 MAG: glycosyltransferase family 4 protein [Chloroflexota bacterium]